MYKTYKTYKKRLKPLIRLTLNFIRLKNQTYKTYKIRRLYNENQTILSKTQ